MDSIRQLNEYLYYEFGFDIEENADEESVKGLV
jgi:hypothetical protein